MSCDLWTRAPQPPVTEKLVKNIFNDLTGSSTTSLSTGRSRSGLSSWKFSCSINDKSADRRGLEAPY